MHAWPTWGTCTWNPPEVEPTNFTEQYLLPVSQLKLRWVVWEGEGLTSNRDSFCPSCDFMGEGTWHRSGVTPRHFQKGQSKEEQGTFHGKLVSKAKVSSQTRLSAHNREVLTLRRCPWEGWGRFPRLFLCQPPKMLVSKNSLSCTMRKPLWGCSCFCCFWVVVCLFYVKQAQKIQTMIEDDSLSFQF